MPRALGKGVSCQPMDELDFLDFTPDFDAPHIIRAYDELPLWSAMFGLLLLDNVPLTGPRAALDVGCGTGFPLIELAERVGPRCQVHGIDTWQGALGRAADKIASRGLSNVELHEASATRMPFPDGSFDLIVSNLGLNNFVDRAGALKECRRVAEPGAVMALTTNLQGHMQEFYAMFEDVLRHVGDDDDLARLYEHVAHRESISSVLELLRSGGFTISKVVERQGWMRFADGTALLNHHFMKLGFLDGWKRIVPTRQRTAFRMLLDTLDEHAGRHGELRLTIPMAYVEATADQVA